MVTRDCEQLGHSPPHIVLALQTRAEYSLVGSTGPRFADVREDLLYCIYEYRQCIQMQPVEHWLVFLVYYGYLLLPATVPNVIASVRQLRGFDVEALS